MRLFIDIDLKAIIASAGVRQAVSSLTFKRGDSSVLDCYFVQDGIVQELDASGPAATGIFGLKALEDYAGDYIVSALTWTKVGTGTSTYYRFEPSFTTVELNTLLIDGTVAGTVADQAARYALTGLAEGAIYAQTDNTTFWEVIDAAELDNAAGWAPAAQLPSVTLMAEIEWIVGTAVSSIDTVTATVPNDVIKGTEGLPTDATPAYPTAAQVPLWLVGITALTGGTGTALDSLPTAAGLYDSRLVLVAISGALRLYQLLSGTDAEASPGIIRPDDYATTTNERVWKQVL